MPSADEKFLSNGRRIASVRLFKDLNANQLSQVVAAAHEFSFEKDGFLFQQEDEAQRVFVLMQGKVKLSQLTLEGQQIILHYASAVEEFGLVAVLTGASYPVTAQAVEDCLLLAWDKVTLQQLMAQYPQMALNAIQVLAGYLQDFQDRIREMATERVARRIARALLRLANQTGRKTPQGVLIDMPLSRQDLAEMTGTTLFTVSRVLSQWESRGLIQSGREQITIRFPHGIVRIAEDLAET